MAALNVFKLCSGLRVLGYFMIFLVVAIIGVSYYAVVVITWGDKLFGSGSGGEAVAAVFVVVAFHVLLILLTWSYFVVVFSDPGSVPENWEPMLGRNSDTNDLVFLQENVDNETRGSMQSSSEVMERRPGVGFCSHCHNSKPQRCHHCSVCQRCVLKMDHHCIWVVNCVGARNYKAFLLFLIYTFLETTLDAVSLLPHFIQFFGEGKAHSVSAGNLAITVLAFVLNLAFAASLTCFLVMHASLISSNTTSIEVYEKKRTERWKYDLGRKKNFEQVFGTKKSLWFFPMFSKDDLANIPALSGLHFPTWSDLEAGSNRS